MLDGFSSSGLSPYAWLMVLGLALSAVYWARRARRDDRLIFVFLGALVGAFLGAKIAYFVAEGWRDVGASDAWLRLATGKSILGALPGGYAGVELAKARVGYREKTGDAFAAIAPAGIGIGRIGCLLHGCCLGHVCGPHWFAWKDAAGVPRWPAVPAEILFNAAALLVFFVLRRQHRFAGQHFHLYLIAYGLFRFVHEFLRDTPRVLGPISGYQLIALGVTAFGVIAFRRRHVDQTAAC